MSPQTYRIMHATRKVKVPKCGIDALVYLANIRRIENKGKNTILSVMDIVNDVSTIFGVEVDEIISQSRKQDLVMLRYLCMYLSRKITFHSVTHIGKVLGGRDHTSVLHGLERFQNLLQTKDDWVLVIWDKYIIHSKIWQELHEQSIK